jgi:hypothetical protein
MLASIAPDTHTPESDRFMVVSCLTATFLSIGAAVFAYRRTAHDNEPTQSCWTWAAVAFLLGPVGLVLRRCMVPTPPREVCSACGKARVMTAIDCQHCRVPLALPALDGTEIFA